jgi:hypothetical protein
MKKQTATEYFYDRVINIFTKYHEEDVPTIDFGAVITEAFDTAQAMEKEQIIDTYNKAAAFTLLQIGEQYYNETYGK